MLNTKSYFKKPYFPNTPMKNILMHISILSYLNILYQEAKYVKLSVRKCREKCTKLNGVKNIKNEF